MTELEKVITDPQGHQMRADVSTSNGGPWWVNAILKLGVTTAIAVGLVWFLTQEVKRSLDGINNSVTTQTQFTNSQATTMAAHERQTEELRTRLTQILQVLQVSCVNAAKDAGMRSACFK